MRQAFDGSIILTSKKDAIRAVTFGFDFCAEHEWGTKFQSAFGVDTDLSGEKGRVWNQVPESFVWVTCGEWEGFGYMRPDTHRTLEQAVKSFRGSRNTEILSAWDENDFVFMAKDPKSIKLLKEFFQLCQDKKSCFFPAGVAGGSGLCIAITSLWSNELKEVAKKDAEKLEAKAAFEKTAAKAKLDSLLIACRGKKIFCSYPCFMGAKGAVFNAKEKRLYWLNDSRMGKPFGWMTDAELCTYIDSPEKEFLGGSKSLS